MTARMSISTGQDGKTYVTVRSCDNDGTNHQQPICQRHINLPVE
jgi:hypothetical protein